MANNSKRSSNRAGAVLITVLTVACFAAILLTAVLTFVKRAHTNAYNNYNSEQAYYIASSALGSVHDYFEQQKDQNYPDLVTYAEANTNGTITLGNSAIGSVIPGGDCKVNISKVNDGYIRLSVTGYYNGQAETINAYYTVTPGQKSAGIDNALYCNGTASFNQQCGNTGSLTTAADYKVANGSGSSGSVITGGDFIVNASPYRWTSDPNNLASSYIVVEGSMFVNDTGASFVPTYSKENTVTKTYDNSSLFISLGRAYFGGTNLTIGAPKCSHDKEENIDEPGKGMEMDMYCNTAFLGESADTDYYRSTYGGDFRGAEAILDMCGNLYCYKIDDPNNPDFDNAQDGDLIFASGNGGLYIEGDVYVEGNIIFRENYNKRVKIRKLDYTDPNSNGGTLYVSSTTEIISSAPLNDEYRITCEYISGEGLTYEKVKGWIDAGVLRFNGVSSDDVEGIKARIKTDPINHGTSTSRNYKPSTKFDPNYIKHYETTPEFLANPLNVSVKQKYDAANYTNMFKYRKDYRDTDLDLDVAYYIDGSIPGDNGGCYIDETSYGTNPNFLKEGSGKIIFVDMNQIDGDYVIRIKGSGNPRSYEMPLIIVKNGERNSNGDIIEEPQGCLYLISDTSMGSNLNITVNSQGSSCGAGLMDYYTYIFANKQKRGINVASFGNSLQDVVYINEASGYTGPDHQDYGIYTPTKTHNFIMINPGDKISLEGSQNDTFIEAIVYASQAQVESIGGYGTDNRLFLKDVNKNELQKYAKERTDVKLSVLGAMICESANCHNTFGISFIPPCNETNIGGGGAAEDVGSVKFSHYESR